MCSPSCLLLSRIRFGYGGPRSEIGAIGTQRICLRCNARTYAYMYMKWREGRTGSN